jgi:hypothetical protein
MKEAEVDDRTAKRIRNGHQPEWEEISRGFDLSEVGEDYMKFVKRMELVAIVKTDEFFENKKRGFKIMRIFN